MIRSNLIRVGNVSVKETLGNQSPAQTVATALLSTKAYEHQVKKLSDSCFFVIGSMQKRSTSGPSVGHLKVRKKIYYEIVKL